MENDRIFVGTESKGLFIFDSKSQQQIARYSSIKTQTNTIGGDYIISLYIDHQKIFGVVWWETESAIAT
ncbi:MAG: hypothetical protein IPL20_17520 [Saprospiraceae bacterium]|nr:hypothetical protein [Saprospiraceae bacterium]